jgi:hypothetical protein
LVTEQPTEAAAASIDRLMEQDLDSFHRQRTEGRRDISH